MYSVQYVGLYMGGGYFYFLKYVFCRFSKLGNPSLDIYTAHLYLDSIFILLLISISKINLLPFLVYLSGMCLNCI